MTKLFLKDFSDQELDLDTHHIRCKIGFGEMCDGVIVLEVLISA